MACKVTWTERAQDDVDNIICYIAIHLASPQAARNLLSAFTDAADRIARHPELHAISQQPSCAARNLRACFIKHYVLLYTYNGEDTVVVYRVFSTLQDYAALIEHSE